MPFTKAFGHGAVVRIKHCFPAKTVARLARASENFRSRVRIQTRAQVISPSGSVSGGIEENCFSVKLRSPFHLTATNPFNAAP